MKTVIGSSTVSEKHELQFDLPLENHELLADRHVVPCPDEEEEIDQEMAEAAKAEGTEDVGWWTTITPYKVFVLVLLLLAFLLNQLDRFMLAITNKSIAQDIKYGDKGCMANTTFTKAELQGIKCEEIISETNCTSTVNSNNSLICEWNYNGQGLLYQIIAGPVFIVIFTFSGIFVGFMADKYNRKNLLAICCVFWSVMTLLMGFVEEYWQLALLRFGQGLGEAGCTPFAASIITDYFTTETRGLAIGIYNWGIYMGYSLAYAFGNFITLADINGQGWRWSFFLSGAPGILLGIVIFIFLKEPERKRDVKKGEDSAPVADLSWVEKLKKIGRYFISPSVILICLGGSIRNASGYVFAYSTQPYFTLIGQTKEQIGTWMSWIPLVGGSLSVLVGGFIADRVVKKRGLYGRISIIFVSLIIAAPFAAGTLYFDPPAAFAFQIPTYLFGEMWIGITLAVIVELMPADIRTTGVALYLFIITNIGGNIQLLIPSIREAFESADYTKTQAWRATLYILYPGPYIYGALVYILVFIVVKRDQKRAQSSNYHEMDGSADKK
ncbi:LOW QUALITY PROTEIN: MFS-type efflux pump MSMEG_3705-like [Pecten maximus]|uniref:LOW QUALITY PROTEIN: MFS-type efflux pump MSMEG_3705-like n=1 Tax=Pecten maximus TaxID=6579 RepID=UPI0014586D7D|nr:LOW QUALITY PROTEIN: MFS-type efflux pump MSMEG_3705-like [Pecten maximus]